jgi:hypothetical protein
MFKTWSIHLATIAMLFALLTPPMPASSVRFPIRFPSPNTACVPYPCGAPRCTKEGYPIAYYIYPCFNHPQRPVHYPIVSHQTVQSTNFRYAPRWNY